jgi:hypothetical protein
MARLNWKPDKSYVVLLATEIDRCRMVRAARVVCSAHNMSVSESVRDIRFTTHACRAEMAFPRNGTESKYPGVPKNRVRAVDASSQQLRRSLEMIPSCHISGMKAGCAPYA